MTHHEIHPHCTVVAAAVVGLLLLQPWGALAEFSVCASTDCKDCVAHKVSADTCEPATQQRNNGGSAMYTCDVADGNVTIFTYLTSDCSGQPVSSIEMNQPDECHTLGTYSFTATCGAVAGRAQMPFLVAVIAVAVVAFF